MRNQDTEKRKMRVAIDIEGMWRYSLETMLLVLREADEQKKNPNIKSKCIHELIMNSSVKPMQIVIFSDGGEQRAEVESNHSIPNMREYENGRDYDHEEYSTFVKAETPRYVI